MNNRKKITALQIKAAMDAKGISRKRLAEMLGKSPSEVTRWLSGEHNFTINVLEDISSVLDAPLSGLVDGYGTETEHILELHDSCAASIMLSSNTIQILERTAKSLGQTLESYAASILTREAERKNRRAADYCGIWTDEMMGETVQEQIQEIKALHQRQEIKEL